MKIGEIVSFLESLAHPSLQESYDNAGLLTGDRGWTCTGILCCLDATEEVIAEAISKRCNVVVAHHPIIFGGIKRLTGQTYVERTVVAAIKNDIAIYAIHTNLDNVLDGVNGRMAKVLGLQHLSVLAPRPNTLKKLFTFVPVDQAEKVRNAIFSAGGGQISDYSECSFNVEGQGTFKAGTGSHPYVGEPGKRHTEREIKVEVILPAFLEQAVVSALKSSHPYEEVAFDVIPLSNMNSQTGSGVIGELAEPMEEREFLRFVSQAFHSAQIRHTAFCGQPVKKVALCGGAGSFLISKALSGGAQMFISSDIKYHEFFDANGRMVIADIGHYESEQFTINLLQETLEQKFPTFAVLKTDVNTNPVKYFS